MSAVRRSETRASTRNQISSPYGRPTPKKSTWSFSGLLNFFNPLRIGSGSSNNGAEESSSSQTTRNSGSTLLPFTAAPPVSNLSARGHELSGRPMILPANGNATLQLAPPPAPSTSQPPPSRAHTLPSSSSLVTLPAKSTPNDPVKNLKLAKDILQDNLDKPFGRAEKERVLSLLDQCEKATKPEPFRFTTLPPPKPQEQSPTNGVATTASTNPFAASSSKSSGPSGTTGGKTLSYNPNGTYRWLGAGSAQNRRIRNRYTSPAFGPSYSQDRIILKSDEDKTKSGESKRRRTESESLSAISGGHNYLRSPGPEPTPGRVNHAQSLSQVIPQSPTTPTPQTSSPASPTRPRLVVPQKPTTPAIPSPLRYAWSNGSPEGGIIPAPLASTTRQITKTANLMVELIKEATPPPKKPDVSNPYQTANPVFKAAVTKIKPRPKKPRVIEKKPEPLKSEEDVPQNIDVEKEHSAQVIIEATVPKGSKRSRPPTKIDPLGDSPSTETAETKGDEREEPEEQQIAKRVRANWNGMATANGSTEVGRDKDGESLDVEMEETSSKTASITKKLSPPPVNSTLATTTSSNKLPSFAPYKAAPKEPSKLRYSYQPEASSSPPVAAPEAKKSVSGSGTVHYQIGFTLAPPATTTSTPTTNGPATIPEPITPTPTKTTLDNPKSVATESVDPKKAVLALPLTSLPVYVFVNPITVRHPLDHSTTVKQVENLPESSLPNYDMILGVAAPLTVESAPTKPACLAGNSTQPSTKGFNWAASGLAAPALTTGSWTCMTCQLSNPDSVKDKCTVCEEPKPGSSTAAPASTPLAPSGSPSGPMQGFNWEAAGSKPPNHGGWTCPTCLLQNPATAAVQCAVCEEPRPGAAPAPPTPAPKPTPPAVPPTGFNWGAAGIKPLTSSATQWTCSTCSLQNPASEKEKCTICETPRPGAPSESMEKNLVTPPAPPAGGFSWGGTNISLESSNATAVLPVPPLGGFKWGAPSDTSAVPPAVPNGGFKFGGSSSNTPSTPTPSGGFNWVAAGIKPLSASGTWTCSTCSLTNPDSAKSKCTICEADRPEKSSSSNTVPPTFSIPSVPSGGFSFGGSVFGK